jgi:hypothetical protein
LLVNIKRIKRAYNSENIAKIIISIIEIIISIKRLKFFIKDNDSINNIIIRAIFIYLRLNIKDSNSERIKYFNYIINLTVKIFLFGKDADAFEEKS